MAKAKAIFVDGASLWNMLRIHNVGRTDYPALYSILVKELGSDISCYGKPFYTSTESYKKQLAAAGFEAAVADSKTSEDDRAIRERILGLSPDEVSEIILVSADFLDYADCLRPKIAEGMRVILVATRAAESSGRGGTPVLSHAAESLMAECGITFVELGNYVERLRLQEFRDKRREDTGAKKPPACARLTLILPEGSTALPAILKMVAAISTAYPEVIYKFTNEGI